MSEKAAFEEDRALPLMTHESCAETKGIYILAVAGTLIYGDAEVATSPGSWISACCRRLATW